MTELVSRDGGFALDGQEFQWISGAIHYWRVPVAYWRDRLEKLLAQGCNALETYVPWNLHEPRPGEFDFDGELDLEAFIRLADEVGLRVIIRPSPYICAEFEFGGLPWWLLKDPLMRVRTPYAGFMTALRRYYGELVPRIAALQASCGGPVIACQIENEYGYFGNNKAYLAAVRDLLIDGGIDCLLFTVDGPWGEALAAGSLDGVLATGSFGAGAPEHFRKMRAMRPGDPLVCGEFWMGWFDAWGDEHHTRDPLDAASSLEEILSEGHVNLYMFHGGTNFGFTSGANHYEELKPDVTSYDYDAPLSEAGDPTPKFFAFRDVIARHARDAGIRQRLATPYEETAFSTAIRKRALGRYEAIGSCTLDQALPSLSTPVTGDRPLQFEEMDQGYGYALYRARLAGPRQIERCVLHGCNDRAVVLVNGVVLRTLEAGVTHEPFTFDLPEEDNCVDLLVENQGRVNFGEKLDGQRKGLAALIIDKHAHCDIESWPLPLHPLPDLPWEPGPATARTATFTRFAFEYQREDDAFEDSFLRLDGWGKGVVWLNGRNLGRFWDIGPQRALYVPGPWLRQGGNDVVVLETEGRCGPAIEFTDQPDLG